MSDVRLLESGGLRATEVATDLRALESYATDTTTWPVGTILNEPFNNLTAWVLTTGSGTPSIVAGRTGTAMTITGTIALARYIIPVASESDTLTMGFAFKATEINATSGNEIATFRSDNNTRSHTTLAVLADGSLRYHRTGTTLGTSAAGLIVANAWNYIELQTKLGDAPNGAATVRLNGTDVIGPLTGIDTKAGGTKTVYDTVQLGPVNVSPGTNLYDDLYLAGGGYAFLGDTKIADGPRYADDFNRADGPPGSNWDELGDGTWSIVSNKLVRTGGTDWIDWIISLGSDDNWVEAEVTGANANYAVVHARSFGIGASCYMGFLVPGASTATIGKNTGGFAYADVASATFAHGDAHKLRLEVEGSAQRFYVDDVLAVTGSDTSVVTGPYVGLNTNSGSCTFDNFATGTL